MELRDYLADSLYEFDNPLLNPKPRKTIPKLVTDDAQSGRLGYRDLSIYQTERDIALSGRSIVDEIDTTALPHVPDRGESTIEKVPSSWWPHLRNYTRIVGAAAHEDIETFELYADGLQEIKDWDEIETRQQALGEWPASNVEIPREVCVYDNRHQEVLSSAERESRRAADNYRNWAEQHGAGRTITTENVLVATTLNHPHPYGCKLDALIYPEESDNLETALTVVEIKVSETIKPRHVAQAEAYRRAVDVRLEARVEAVVVRVGLQRDDFAHLHSGESEWPEEEVWDAFCSKAEELYSDHLVQAAIDNADTR